MVEDRGYRNTSNLSELSGAQRNKQYYHHHYRHQASRQILKRILQSCNN